MTDKIKISGQAAFVEVEDVQFMEFWVGVPDFNAPVVALHSLEAEQDLIDAFNAQSSEEEER